MHERKPFASSGERDVEQRGGRKEKRNCKKHSKAIKLLLKM
jgi:hypothetical protein